MSSDESDLILQAKVPPQMAGRRLDQVLAELFTDWSRSKLTSWIKDGRVSVDGNTVTKPREKLFGDEDISVRVIEEIEAEAVPQDIPLDIVYEDDTLMVINKPAGMVVHPAAGNPDGTLVNGLLFYRPEQAQLPRAGIVHRLDKETTGLMVVAKTAGAHKSLVEQLQARTVKRQYEAVIQGRLTAGGTVDQPIGRHPSDRKRQAVWPTGKPAVTHYRVIERYRAHTLVQCRLETGRTHQIRVHMSYIRHPIVGDPTYGGRVKLPPRAGDALVEILREFGRQALHARRLGLEHPETGEWMEWERRRPDDMHELVEILRGDLEDWEQGREEDYGLESVWVDDSWEEPEE